MPRCAQQQDFSFATIFALMADILAVVALAVTSKENSNFPDLGGLLGGGGS